MRALTTALLALGVSASVQADVDEVEFNHPISASQYVTIVAEPTVIQGYLGNGGYGDLDFYSFSGQAGDVVTLDIDNGIGGVRSVDTTIAIFDQSYRILARNDDASIDPGSISTFDSRIDNYVLPQTGTYIVGVSNWPRMFLSGGELTSTTVREGDYTLLISGIAPRILQIGLAIKPGSDEPTPLNPKSKGKIPVALLGNVNFDVHQVDVASLTFGAKGTEQSLVRCDNGNKDVNGDGRPDRVCHFENQKAAFSGHDETGILRGRMLDGSPFEGRGWLKVVPKKLRN